MPETARNLRPLYIIAGPTASGKTALAIALAQKLAQKLTQKLANSGGGVIVNMDAMQLYRELPILTAQPDAAEQAQAPHRLYSIRDAAQPANAAWWATQAQAEITAITTIGHVPILCGGTGLYLTTLLDGIAPVPDVPHAVRAAGSAIIAAQGSAALHARLDPAMQARLQPGDTQRVLRAWEVLQATGRSLADWQAEPHVGALQGYVTRIIVLEPPRAALYARCDARFKAMLAAGALDEVAALQALALPDTVPLLKACGVPELSAHLAGTLSLAAATAAGQQATRNYAKRQTTWFTNQLATRRNTCRYAGFGHESTAIDAITL